MPPNRSADRAHHRGDLGLVRDVDLEGEAGAASSAHVAAAPSPAPSCTSATQTFAPSS